MQVENKSRAKNWTKSHKSHI